MLILRITSWFFVNEFIVSPGTAYYTSLPPLLFEWERMTKLPILPHKCFMGKRVKQGRTQRELIKKLILYMLSSILIQYDESVLRPLRRRKKKIAVVDEEEDEEDNALELGGKLGVLTY